MKLTRFSCMVILKDKASLSSVIKPLSIGKEVDPYIVVTKEEIINKMKELGKRPSNTKKFAKEWYGIDMFDSEGNGLSTLNKDAVIASYALGGEYSGILYNKRKDPVNMVQVKDISWETTRKRLESLAKNNWKEAMNMPKGLNSLLLYGINENTDEHGYITLFSQFSTDAVIDKDGSFHNFSQYLVCKEPVPSHIDILNAKGRWKMYFYNRFLRDLNDDDIIAIIDAKL